MVKRVSGWRCDNRTRTCRRLYVYEVFGGANYTKGLENSLSWVVGPQGPWKSLGDVLRTLTRLYPRGTLQSSGTGCRLSTVHVASWLSFFQRFVQFTACPH